MDNRVAAFISSDHRGFEQKNVLIDRINADLPELEARDLGPTTYDETDDFNDAAIKVCREVLTSQSSIGILFCGSAIGIAMQANRFKGIRAVAAYSPEIARLSREHEDANVLCLSADLNTDSQNYNILKTFLAAKPLTDERHQRRIRRLDEDLSMSKNEKEEPHVH